MRDDSLWRLIEARDASLAQMDAAFARQERVLAEKDAMIAELHEVAQQYRTGLEEKERTIQLLDRSLMERAAPAPAPPVAAAHNEILVQKEAVIAELRRALAAYRAAFAPLRPLVAPLSFMLRMARAGRARAARALSPRLGQLSHHAPRELRLPRAYAREPRIDSPPVISIVTPSYNQAAFIERTLRSVLDQDYPRLEYVVQDGGSSDGTVEILERYSPRLTAWQSQRDGGQSAAINAGFAKTGGEIMAWLNSDDVLLPGALWYVARYFAGHPEVDVVYGHRVLLDEEDREIGRWVLPAHSDEILSWADFVPQETLFWRRRIWERAGGRVDESFRFAMDWDLLLRFRDAGARFTRLPRFLAGFRIHAQQKTSAVIGEVGFQEMDRLRRRALGRVPTRLEVRKAVAPYLLRHVANHVRWRIGERLGAG